MKKLITTLVVLFALAPLAPLSVNAQTSTVDDSKIEESLRKQGLDKAPGVVEVPKSEMRGLEPSSGFVDENGKPLSDEEYAKYLKSQEGIFKKYPWLLAVIAIIIIGGVAGIIKLKKKKQ